MQNKVTEEGYLLLEALQTTQYLSTVFKVLSKGNLGHSVRNKVVDARNKQEFILRNFKDNLSDAKREQYNQYICSDEDVIQFANIRNIFFNLDKEKQDKVEAFIESL